MTYHYANLLQIIIHVLHLINLCLITLNLRRPNVLNVVLLLVPLKQKHYVQYIDYGGCYYCSARLPMQLDVPPTSVDDNNNGSSSKVSDLMRTYTVN
jgi:hypothetical protein